MIIAAPPHPADIVFNIRGLKCTLLLQLIPGTAVPDKSPFELRHVEDVKPRRKTRRGESAEHTHTHLLLETQKAAVLVTCQSQTVFGPLEEAYHVDFPPLPPSSGPVCVSASPGLGVYRT